ncbi:poly polymerase [Parasponia andersonii]|uniref:Poly polymerase n=1 Tax=Parasponia andersonii TaxID=3476 RepID=A0A2P5ACJ6_PARAD|nr:poly polymerase [Parasponia andersonii]
MGSCFSSVRSSGSVAPTWASSTTSAKVISVDGDLRQYPAPVLVSHVLAEAEASSSSSSSSSVFMCNSESLYFDQVIPALELEDQLQPNQIYFVLSSSKREQPLSASDMAALAVKASVALRKDNDGHSRRRKYSRISPLSSFVNLYNHTHLHLNKHKHDDDSSDGVQFQFDQDYYTTIGSSSSSAKKKPYNKTTSSSSSTTPLGISRSGSVRKLRRFTSTRAKLAVRSFRIRLTTIYEGTIL